MTNLNDQAETARKGVLAYVVSHPQTVVIAALVGVIVALLLF